ILVWDPNDYGNQTLIHPVPEKIWRPRVFLLNTLGDRDLFKDDVAPVMVTNTGFAGWVPGSLIPASCELHLEDYPFDQQTCTINFVSMSHSTSELVFVANSPKILLDFFIKHGEWELKDTNLTIKELVAAGWKGSTIELKFELKRRPTFLLINIVLPVVFLSFLNILVFIIPADSGEKISYGITVLLALSVFLSIVGSLLPRSGEATPKLTIYLFLLLIISMLTVIDSIIIVYLAHKDEQETMHRRAKENFQSAFSKTQTLTKTVSVMMNNKVHADLDKRQDHIMMLSDALKPRSPSFVKAPEDVHDAKENKTSLGVNKYRLIGKHIDCTNSICDTICYPHGHCLYDLKLWRSTVSVVKKVKIFMTEKVYSKYIFTSKKLWMSVNAIAYKIVIFYDFEERQSLLCQSPHEVLLFSSLLKYLKII
ncbi:acetylcholine receptor subunit alpha, partial [Biomphalaria pfeifferi]